MCSPIWILVGHQYDGLEFSCWRKKRQLPNTIIKAAPCWITLTWLITFHHDNTEWITQLEGQVENFRGQHHFVPLSFLILFNKTSAWPTVLILSSKKIERKACFFKLTKKGTEDIKHKTPLCRGIFQFPNFHVGGKRFPLFPRAKCYKNKSSKQ